MRDYRLSVPAGAFFAIFAVSGFAGLIYESIWTHYLKLFLGHAAYAQTLVLAIFMGGMAIGSWFTAVYSGRLRNLLVGYAVVEALIGVAAIGFHVAFVGATNYAHEAVLPSMPSPVAAQFVKWGLAACFILPQSVLLGMTFPLMSGGIIRRFPESPGRSLATLYFANSLGAAVGVLASGFVLIGLVGLPGTMLTAGLMNIALALLVWLLAKGGEPRSGAARPTPDVPWRQDRWVTILLAAAAVTGAASFLYEIAWIRMLSLVLGSSTHSFELMLSAFILGLALGGLYVRRRIDGLQSPVRFLAYVQLFMGAFALATLPVYGESFEWMSYLMRAVGRTEQGYGVFIGASSLIALLIMLPATFCAGMTLPLLTYVLLGRGHGERTIGSVYALNTVGAIVGILVAVHVLMPAVGVKGTVLVGAALDLALGVVLLASAVPAVRRFELGAGAIAATLALVVVAGAIPLDPLRMVSGVYRTGKSSLSTGAQVAFHADGKTATVALIGDRKGGYLISTNGKTDAKLTAANDEPSPDESTMILAGALALAHHPKAKLAANIGFGSGLTTHALLSTPQLEHLDTIEIERFMVEAARGFGERVRNAYEDPRSRIHIEDAKTFFSTRDARYDIIISEPSNPWVSGVASLFTEEFYARVRRHLQPDGVFVQWLQGYEIDMPLVASVLKALDPHFSDYVMYATNDVDLLIIARPEGRLAPIDGRVLEHPGLARELARVKVAGVADLNFRRLWGKPLVQSLISTYPVPANSDYFPFLDQHAARARFLNRAAIDELTLLRVGPLPMMEMLERRAPTARGTAITRDEEYLRAALADDAVRTRDAMAGKAGWDNVPEASARDWMLVTLGLERCDLKADWGQWRAAIRRIAGQTLPYLTPHDARGVVARLQGSACFKRLDARSARWLELLDAVAGRDAAQMTSLATALLEAGETEAQTYLVHAAMIGALAQDRGAVALAVWEKHGRKLLEGKPIPLDTRLLVALAAGQTSTQASLDRKTP